MSVRTGSEQLAAGRRALLCLVMVLLASSLVVVGVGPAETGTAVAAAAPSVKSVVPARLLETRSGPGLATYDGKFYGAGQTTANGIIELAVAGRGGVPVDAEAVFLNVTVVNPGGSGVVTVFPCGATKPNASNLNYVAGDVVPNAVFAKIGAGGKVCVWTQTPTHLVIDVNGFVAVSVTGPVLVALPVRLDTELRPSSAGLTPGEITDVAARCNARLARQACESGPIFFSANGGQTRVSEHVDDAIATGQPSALNYDARTGQSRPNWTSRFPQSDCALTQLAASDCDEYPFFKSVQGYDGTAATEPSLRRVSSSANRSHGGSYGVFLTQCDLREPPATFSVLPVHDIVAVDTKSFWLCGTAPNNQSHDPSNPAPNGAQCTVQRFVAATTVDKRIAASSVASSFVETGWFVVWSPGRINLSGVDHIRIDNDRTVSLAQYPTSSVSAWVSDFSPGSGPLNAELVLRNASNQELRRVPCQQTSNGLDPITAGAVLPRSNCTHLGTAGDDTIIASSGNDIICPMAGDDIVDAGAGDDFVALYNGNDTADTGPGDDTVYPFPPTSGDLNVAGGTGDDVIVGGEGDDIILGGPGDDLIRGSKGDDLIDGEEGNDDLVAGQGNDTILGGPGDDRAGLSGHGGGATSPNFDSGDDFYSLSPGQDVVSETEGVGLATGSGNDIVVTGNVAGSDLGDRLERAIIWTGSGDDRIYAGPGQIMASGGSGNDIIDVAGEPDGPLAGNPARTDSLDGGPGNDLLRHVSPFESPVAAGIAASVKGGEGNDLIVTLDASFDWVALEPSGFPVITVGGCTLVAGGPVGPGESVQVNCSFPFFGGVFTVSVSSDETVSVTPNGDLGYFLDSIDALEAAIDANQFGLESLTGDSCICDPTITTPQGIVLLSDNQ